MKKFILLFVFLISTTSLVTAQDTKTVESVESLMDKALSDAVASDKHFLIKFEASWCGWCHRMTDNINDERVSKFFNDNYVLLPIIVFENGDKIKLENPGSRDLVAKYKGEKAGLPFWVIVDSSGNVVTDSFNKKGQNLGCPASVEEVASFVSKLKATSNMTAMDEKNIIKTFVKK